MIASPIFGLYIKNGTQIPLRAHRIIVIKIYTISIEIISQMYYNYKKRMEVICYE